MRAAGHLSGKGRRPKQIDELVVFRARSFMVGTLMKSIDVHRLASSFTHVPNIPGLRTKHQTHEKSSKLMTVSQEQHPLTLVEHAPTWGKTWQASREDVVDLGQTWSTSVQHRWHLATSWKLAMCCPTSRRKKVKHRGDWAKLGLKNFGQRLLELGQGMVDNNNGSRPTRRQGRRPDIVREATVAREHQRGQGRPTLAHSRPRAVPGLGSAHPREKSETRRGKVLLASDASSPPDVGLLHAGCHAGRSKVTTVAAAHSLDHLGACATWAVKVSGETT